MQKTTLFRTVRKPSALLRVDALNARLAALRVLAPSLGVVAASTVAAPACCRCGERRPVVFLCDENGRSLPRSAGGFCRECVPSQPEDEAAPSTGTPASLDLVESVSIDEQIAVFNLRVELAKMVAGWIAERDFICEQLDTLKSSPDICLFSTSDRAEISAMCDRLEELEELLIFEV